ncbi:MAG: DEAD/DEAH box helicase, partial [Deltaproteobacteria bacterium]|nr:DEAD/DEAH box helicase [Deltaproteobacteria bacterium]
MSEGLLRDLAAAGFASPTPIQEQAIPPALAGRDVIGCAQTGTGKTAAFVIPIVERLSSLPKGQPKALILAPTRELALQTLTTIEKLGRSRGISATVIVGGPTCKPKCEVCGSDRTSWWRRRVDCSTHCGTVRFVVVHEMLVLD